jgi:hypothetical protein
MIKKYSIKGIIPQGKPCTCRLRRLSAASRGVLNPSFPHSLGHVRASTAATSLRSSIIIIGLVLFSCVGNNKFVENNIFNEYIRNNTITISYSVDVSQYVEMYSIDGSQYVTIGFQGFDLSNEQRNNLIHFIEVFQSSDKYIKYINKDLNKYGIIRIDLRKIDILGFNYTMENEIEYGIFCVFYSKEKAKHSTTSSIFDEAENLWSTYNMALYRINNDDDIKFCGWHY